MSAPASEEHGPNHDRRHEEAQVGILPEMRTRFADLQEDEPGPKTQQSKRFKMSACGKPICRDTQGKDDDEEA